jgi:hypothetical protein
MNASIVSTEMVKEQLGRSGGSCRFSAFLSAVSSVGKVKSLSPNHRFVIALHSPCGFIETGLPQCPAEKKARKLVGVLLRDIFSGPV